MMSSVNIITVLKKIAAGLIVGILVSIIPHIMPLAWAETKQINFLTIDNYIIKPVIKEYIGRAIE